MIEDIVKDYVKLHNIKNGLIGLSGGVDSIVLATILAKHTDVKLRAIYVDHSLSAQAGYWASFCKDFCKDLNIEFISEKVDANKKKNRQSIEAIAREKRYGAYKRHLKDGECLFLGHHGDDQTETVLLQLFRGTGLSGLSGMSSFQKYQNGFLARPFLHEYKNKLLEKEDIKLYSLDNSIEHITDSSNFENDYRRNYLRNEIIPNITKIFGNINKPVMRASKICAASEKQIEQLTKIYYEDVNESSDKLILSKVICYSDDDISNILRYWMKNINGQRNISHAQNREILKFIRNYTNDNNFKMSWDKKEIKVKNGYIFLD